MEQLLKTLGINSVGHYGKDNIYVVDLEDSEEYGKIYSKLEKSEEYEELDDTSLLTIHNSSIVYESEKHRITLISDFDQDTYKLTIKEI